MFWPIFSRAFAAYRSSAGTTSTTIPPAAGVKKAPAAPQTAAITTRCQTWAVPETSNSTAADLQDRERQTYGRHS